MIRYEVTIHINKDVENSWFEWMKSVHIPDVLKTGLFTSCAILKSTEDQQTGRTTYAFSYLCESLDDLNRYQNECAPALREDHTSRYKGRFDATRTICHILQ
jgi:hypothetical protein